MREYGELFIMPERTFVNRRNGQYLKGHKPHNKGKPWDEWVGKRAQKRMAKGWKNLEKFRPKQKPDNAGRCRKPVIAVMDDGRWLYFPYLGAAAEWLKEYAGHCNRMNIGRCCRENQAKKVCKHDWRPGQRRGASRINTDHKYMGIRFYFESDIDFTTKINS